MRICLVFLSFCLQIVSYDYKVHSRFRFRKSLNIIFFSSLQINFIYALQNIRILEGQKRTERGQGWVACDKTQLVKYIENV